MQITGCSNAAVTYAQRTFILPPTLIQRTVTLVEEYAQGPNCLLYTFPAGAYEPGKHASLRESAEHELSEEAELAGGEWHALLEGDKRPEGISEVE